jgi:NTP pyrophosphatase (non-canonical NTP hydrolase)
MELKTLQRQMHSLYESRDATRGVDATFRWLTEEVGELAKAIRTGEKNSLMHEFGDVLAWLASLANLLEVDLEGAAARYAGGCPRCGETPCHCPMKRADGLPRTSSYARSRPIPRTGYDGRRG